MIFTMLCGLLFGSDGYFVGLAWSSCALMFFIVSIWSRRAHTACRLGISQGCIVRTEAAGSQPRADIQMMYFSFDSINPADHIDLRFVFSLQL